MTSTSNLIKLAWAGIAFSGLALLGTAMELWQLSFSPVYLVFCSLISLIPIVVLFWRSGYWAGRRDECLKQKQTTIFVDGERASLKSANEPNIYPRLNLTGMTVAMMSLIGASVYFTYWAERNHAGQGMNSNDALAFSEIDAVEAEEPTEGKTPKLSYRSASGIRPLTPEEIDALPVDLPSSVEFPKSIVPRRGASVTPSDRALADVVEEMRRANDISENALFQKRFESMRQTFDRTEANDQLRNIVEILRNNDLKSHDPLYQPWSYLSGRGTVRFNRYAWWWEVYPDYLPP